jgi:hypothetical protein
MLSTEDLPSSALRPGFALRSRHTLIAPSSPVVIIVGGAPERGGWKAAHVTALFP